MGSAQLSVRAGRVIPVKCRTGPTKLFYEETHPLGALLGKLAFSPLWSGSWGWMGVIAWVTAWLSSCQEEGRV